MSALSLLWGVRAFYIDEINDLDQAIELSTQILKDKGMIKSGDYVIHVASTPMRVSHLTNMLKVSRVD
jgi:pyruvate kinase